MSDRAAELVEPLACVVSPVLEHGLDPGARVLVIGAGSMGLLAVAALGALARADNTILAKHRFQAEHAERLGATRVVMVRDGDYFAELARITGGRLLQPILGPRIHVGGFDTTFVCVGTDAAVGDALRFTRAGGTIVLLGNVARLARVDWTPLWQKEPASSEASATTGTTTAACAAIPSPPRSSWCLETSVACSSPS